MVDLLFVYGTLGSGYGNEYARLLRANAEFTGKATACGNVQKIGGYSAFVPGPDGEVAGELYRMTNPEALLRILDRYEGDGYDRIVIQIEGFQTWVYALRQTA